MILRQSDLTNGWYWRSVTWPMVESKAVWLNQSLILKNCDFINLKNFQILKRKEVICWDIYIYFFFEIHSEFWTFYRYFFIFVPSYVYHMVLNLMFNLCQGHRGQILEPWESFSCKVLLVSPVYVLVFGFSWVLDILDCFFDIFFCL